MPLPQQWIDALTARHRVRVSSTAELLQGVSTVRAARLVNSPQAKMKPIAVVPGYEPPVFHEFQLFELLHALGEITTPPAPNFADLSATWAIWRYAWAFDVPNA